MKCDVAIIGGGPAGSTVGALLRKYHPSLDVVILERETFPRDHVGESMLPVIPHILHEMGAWDKVEAANFPIKVGATYRWGQPTDTDLWYFYFLPQGNLKPEPRPAKFSGQRMMTAFQVDRAVYDKILLDHAKELGCRVFENTKVSKVARAGDRIDHLDILATGDAAEELGEDTEIEARYYVDASGGNSIVRSTMDVPVHSPTSLRNIAIWDYWINAEWAESVGVGGTYVQVMSIDWGWLWFIPLSATRTSLGLVTSAEYYKASGESTEALYKRAISEEPRIRALVENATNENQLQATKDWSYIADRLVGENWFLAGDACGFADPILAAGMSLAQMGARRVAFSILELVQGSVDEDWIKGQYEKIQRKNIGNHIRFADYWYSANGRFTDLKEYCTQIAKDAGLTLDANAAFQWLGTGGFSDEISGMPFVGSYRLTTIKEFTSKFAGETTDWSVLDNNVFELDLAGAHEEQLAVYENGHVVRVPCLVRGDKVLPIYKIYGIVYKSLQKESEIQLLAERFMYQASLDRMPPSPELGQFCTETLEAMVTEGWVKASYDATLPTLRGYPTGG